MLFRLKAIFLIHTFPSPKFSKFKFSFFAKKTQFRWEKKDFFWEIKLLCTFSTANLPPWLFREAKSCFFPEKPPSFVRFSILYCLRRVLRQIRYSRSDIINWQVNVKNFRVEWIIFLPDYQYWRKITRHTITTGILSAFQLLKSPEKNISRGEA